MGKRKTKRRIKNLIGKEVVVIPKDGYNFLAEVKGVKGYEAVLDIIGVGSESGIVHFSIDKIDDVFLLVDDSLA